MSEFLSFLGSLAILLLVVLALSVVIGLISALLDVDPFNIQEDDDDATKLIKTENNIRMHSSLYKEWKDSQNKK